MSKKRAVLLLLTAAVALLAVWFATLRPEAREALMGLVLGR